VFLSSFLGDGFFLFFFLIFEVLEVFSIFSFILDNTKVILDGIRDELFFDEQSEVIFLLDDVELVFLFFFLIVLVFFVFVDLGDVVVLEEVEEAGDFLDFGDNLYLLLFVLDFLLLFLNGGGSSLRFSIRS
jgi:hypothetical protein